MSKQKKLEELERYLNELENVCFSDSPLIRKAMAPIENFCNRFLGKGYVTEKYVELQCVMSSKDRTEVDVYTSISKLRAAFEQYGEDHEAWKY